MELLSTSTYFRRRSAYYEKRSSPILNKSKSIIVRTPRTHNFTYRTEFYLQQRETENLEKSSSSSVTTWRNLKYQKQILDHDQAEFDRVLSTIDSIHKIFNRSLFVPHNQVYSSLYGNDNKSDRLMKTFCQCQNHYTNYEVSMKENDDDTKIEAISSFDGNFPDTDFDDNMEDDEEKENEKKKSYDSGYGSVIPIREYTREPLLKVTQPWIIK
ncbi:unnamed protein product [Rotaria socialis]|uniref:Uncharacterized protein n=1 Tax=Rotaria socialis TaxID=392032 RepID=A0A817YLN8_9BILA|nr:unnamed protein product [Rotaria socialis]CAF3362812.1 unnamed protein product [Rotaria socialis]CAF3380118.1 unnamed protein product [Rotaria socialis]CAF3580838.1 unnamed protein product [Rotaria socialis]CAF4350210.1 unnamed protein product [Rotaria socialis]